MKRFFYIDDDLDDLEALERELLARGLGQPQIHVLSHDDAGAAARRLHPVHSLLRQDTIHSGEIGALIGLGVSALALALAWLGGLPAQIGWAPFVCLGLVLLGFFTWEGGFIGIQTPNAQFRRFAGALAEGRHLLIVDADPTQEALLKAVARQHPGLRPAGTGSAAPRWRRRWRQRWQDFLQWAP